MIQKYNEEFGGVFDRMEKIIEKRVEERIRKEKEEKIIERIRKEEQEKTDEKINNILNELKKRGINEEDIKAISQLAK